MLVTPRGAPLQCSAGSSASLMSLVTTMLMCALAIYALAVSARADADCEACIDGRCHTRKTIISGFPVTDQLAIDRSRNVLYVQLNGNLNTAVFLDDNEVRLINTKSTTGMVVDQSSKILYMGTKNPGQLYKYDVVSNTTEFRESYRNVDVDKSIKMTVKMFYGYTGLLSVVAYNNSSNIFYVADHGSYVDYWGSFIIGQSISSLVYIKSLFVFVSNNTLYKYNPKWSDPPPATEILNKTNMVISVDKDDNIYIADATEKVIYKFEKDEEKLSTYAAYKSGGVEDFVFGGDNRIVFRDSDGSIVQWVPLPRYVGHRCSVEPPSERFFIRSIESECN